MIIVQTPLRIGLIGGGTDLPDFYERGSGYCLSAAIDKYVYVILKRRFDELIYVNYSKKEIVERVDDLQHDLVREAMRRTGVRDGVEITTLADIPTEGTGLGSSSAVLVALLQALYTYQGILKAKDDLAREACQIELGTLARPIGKQDQYAATYGDLRLYGFHPGGAVTTDLVEADTKTRRVLQRNLMLIYTGLQRRSGDILKVQNERTTQNLANLRRLRDMALEARAELERGNVDVIGEMLHCGWEMKKGFADGITNPQIDEMYQRAREAGAVGGKVTGAGGGGFLLLYCRPQDQEAVRTALGYPRELVNQFDRLGTRVIFNIQ
ncbi:MAG TPA: GHMP kinase [Chloroflexota bacterium]|jgi:D-glycero-alpha-D-manno-heptose-7-phosphate kinase